MNITNFSPALTMVYVFSFICILMGIDLRSFSRKQRWIILAIVLFIGVSNHFLREIIGGSAHVKLMILSLHLPTFLLFLYISKRGVIKTTFMILTAIVFTAPTVIISNLLNRVKALGSFQFLMDLISYSLMILLLWFVFRKSFNYLIIHGNNQFFLLFSLVPLAYYAYMIIAANLDVSSIDSTAGYIFRILPTTQVFLFYFLLPYLYKTLSEKMLMQSAQDVLKQEISLAENQISLLNETNAQMAVYRHDIRHQFIALEGLLSCGKTEQAQAFVKTTMADLEAITPKRFCENEMVNLLCSAYESKAKRLGVCLKINAPFPKNPALSDTELCSVISNGLENALRAASRLETPDKWVEFYCTVKQKKVFIQIQNPYIDQVLIKDGLPVSTQEGHGYGCYSIQSIVQRNGGLCSFETENGLFILRIALSLSDESNI